ncbi:MAG: membrane protein insertion efficiency factor YidD [Oleiphilaceae bacterium]|nr:membrane protein insertion efficiency factor YidD [Oleiphilaceae bacterium]
MRKLIVLPIRFYQYAISPLMASHCRHYPSCSSYAIEAIEQHGPLKGLFFGITRLLRCHPWTEGGYDPVPAQSPKGDAGKIREKSSKQTCCSDHQPNTSRNAFNQTTP